MADDESASVPLGKGEQTRLDILHAAIARFGRDGFRGTSVADIARYAGLWYEIAAIPMWFQRNCLGDTTARYTPNPDGTIDVLNRCRTSEGTNEAHGLARIVDTQSNARLEVSFFSVLGWRPVWGDYWIIALAPDYSWAVVGGPERRHGWILARTPELETATLATIHQRLEELGYDPASFVPTAQQAAPR